MQVEFLGRLVPIDRVHPYVRIEYKFPRLGALFRLFTPSVGVSHRPTTILVPCMLLACADTFVSCSPVMVFARAAQV